MASQANITDYFNSKKRGGCINEKSRAKVLILEAKRCLKVSAQETCETRARVIFQESKKIEIQSSSKVKNQTSASKKTPKSIKRTKKVLPSKNKEQLKQSLLTQFAKKIPHVSSEASSSTSEESKSVSEDDEPLATLLEDQPSTSTAVPSPQLQLSSSSKTMFNSPRRQPGTPRALNFGESPAKSTGAQKVSTPRKELSISEIAAKLKSSSRTAELRASLGKFSRLSERLSNIEAEEEKLKLKEFKDIEVEVPQSPRKVIPYASPVKVSSLSPAPRSPGKALGSRLAAWQQHRALAEARAPTLPLPWRYRSLGDLFQAVDVVAAMMANRGETVNFGKLQPAVEEMTRLNFTEQHLGKIKSLYPEAFSFSQERRKTFVLTGRPDKFELVITPNLERPDNEGTDNNHKLVGTEVLQRRKEHFHKLLVERVKDFHQDFLSHLEPPLEIPRDKLTRWHPGFDAEQIPDVDVAPLPQPPNMEKLSTAREVLDHARNMINCNRRVAAALASAATCETGGEPSSQTEQKTPTPGTNVNTPINPALRGIPKALLEKIRAKQAAQALEAMTRTPAQDIRMQKLQRLPELARILRNLFVAEKKNVMPLDMVLEKLKHCYPHILNNNELSEHLRLLGEEAPSLIKWLQAQDTTFLRLDKQASMAVIMARLEQHIKPT